MMQTDRERMRTTTTTTTRATSPPAIPPDSNSNSDSYSNGYHHHHDDSLYATYRNCNNNNNNNNNNGSHFCNGGGSCHDFNCCNANNLPHNDTASSSSSLLASSSPSPPHYKYISNNINYDNDNNNHNNYNNHKGGGGGRGGGRGFIEHRVSKFDTLAGVAIKYGVEVSDIKKMNGLVTDLQMFALKSLYIPLPGRHPPSPCLSIGSAASGLEFTPPHRAHSDLFGSFQSLRLNPSQQKVSQAMSSLQGYYGLTPTKQTNAYEGLEMALFQKGYPPSLEDSQYLKPSPGSQPPFSHHRKSRSLVGFPNENNILIDDMFITEAMESENEKSSDKLLRRRMKSEADFSSHSPEMLIRNDDNSGDASLTITGKGLALRSKASSRNILSSTDSEAGGLGPVPIALGESLVADNGFSGVRKSSSTSSLQDQDGSSSSVWLTSKWSLAPDLQAFTTAAIARPIFDGLPKPISGRRNKAALD